MTQRLLLCTDLDRTLLPNGSEAESSRAREWFAELVSQPQVTLVYVTGRHRQLVDAAIAEYRLPQPDYVIADVGSSIYSRGVDGWGLWEEWDVAIASDWGGMSGTELAALFRDLPELRLQQPEKQSRHKLSYYLPLEVECESVIAALNCRLEAGAIRANSIYSVDEADAVGLLDILPASAGKRQAIEFLMEHRGFTLENTVFSGDSGNDLAVLASPIPAVLVANASADVKRAAQRQADKCGHPAALYLARGGYMGMNGNYSAGILEGVVHYMPQAQDWFGRHE